MAGVLAHGHHSKSRPGTVESFANTGHSFVPAGTYLIGLNNDPAINGWAIFAASPSAVRRGIFVESKTKINSSPVGAAYSVHIPADVAPERSWIRFEIVIYKYDSPTGFAVDSLSCVLCVSWLKIRPRPGHAVAVGLLPRSLRPARPCRQPPGKKLFTPRRQGAKARPKTMPHKEARKP